MKNIFLIFVVSVFGFSQVRADTTSAVASAASGVMMWQAAGNAAQGKEFTARCSGTAVVYCGMAVLAFVQAAMALKDSDKAQETKEASACVGSYCSYGGGGSLGDPGVNTGGPGDIGGPGGVGDPNSPGYDTGGNNDPLAKIQDGINDGLKDLENKGYTYDPSSNSVNTPNGSIPASSYASSDGLKGLGMSDGQISDLHKVAKDALKNAQKYVDGFDGGGGGTKAKPGPGYDSGGFDMNKYLASLGKKKDTRGVAGLEKKYGSDQIGVAQDDIFKMVHRRYEVKKPTLHH